jgi:hypothetical protein
MSIKWKGLLLLDIRFVFFMVPIQVIWLIVLLHFLRSLATEVALLLHFPSLAFWIRKILMPFCVIQLILFWGGEKT